MLFSHLSFPKPPKLCLLGHKYGCRIHVLHHDCQLRRQVGAEMQVPGIGPCPSRAIKLFLWIETVPAWKLCALVWGCASPWGSFSCWFRQRLYRPTMALNLLSRVSVITYQTPTVNTLKAPEAETRSGDDGSSLFLCLVSQSMPARSFLGTDGAPPGAAPRRGSCLWGQGAHAAALRLLPGKTLLH